MRKVTFSQWFLHHDVHKSLPVTGVQCEPVYVSSVVILKSDVPCLQAQVNHVSKCIPDSSLSNPKSSLGFGIFLLVKKKKTLFSLSDLHLFCSITHGKKL